MKIAFKLLLLSKYNFQVRGQESLGYHNLCTIIFWSLKCTLKTGIFLDLLWNRKTRVFQIKTRVGTGTRVLKKVGFSSITSDIMIFFFTLYWYIIFLFTKVCHQTVYIYNLNCHWVWRKIADVSIPDSPPPPPSKVLTYFMDGPLSKFWLSRLSLLKVSVARASHSKNLQQPCMPGVGSVSQGSWDQIRKSNFALNHFRNF